MKILANSRDWRSYTGSVFVTFSALSLTACGVVDEMRKGEKGTDLPAVAASVPETDAEIVEQIVADADDCLLVVWEAQEERDIAFDRAHDQAEGGAISCATGTSPSQFERAIASIRDAAGSGDKARMLREVDIPLIYIDNDGNRRALADPQTVDAVFDEVFDGATMAMLQRIDLSQMTVVPEQKGGFFELGSLWLVVDEPGSRPRIVTVNRQAIMEAAEAARAKAQAGENGVSRQSG